MKFIYPMFLAMILNLTAVQASDLPCCPVNGQLQCGTKLDCDPRPPECPAGETLSCWGGHDPECECREVPPGENPPNSEPGFPAGGCYSGFCGFECCTIGPHPGH